jgi:S-DNA-T family DNA segregation ATPase FtsK/SpoIIIE
MNQFFKKIFRVKDKNEQADLSDSFIFQRKTDFENSQSEEGDAEERVPPISNDVSIIPTAEANDDCQNKEKSYDPVLDLNNYKFPELKLFSDSVQDTLNSFEAKSIDYKLPVLWSRTDNKLIIKDFAELANILIIGTQASGKTNFLHQLIISLLLKKNPSQLKLVLADIKGLDIGIYKPLEKHFLARLPGIEDATLKDSKNLIHSLNALCIEMDNRYDLIVDAGVRNITEYNTNFVQRKLNPEKGHQFLPFIIFIIDDLGLYTYQGSPEINLPLVRLISEGYKAGICTIVSTSQINSLSLPNNLLSMINQRVVFRLNSKEDYRRFFDTTKFEIPLEEGKFLYNHNGHIETGQSILFPMDDIKKMVELIACQPGYSEAFLLPEYVSENEFGNKAFDLNDRDPLFEDAARLIVQSQSGSTSLLQRRMKLGYNRAGKLMDQLEAAGIVGPNLGSKVRDVLVKTESELKQYLI